MSRLILIVVIAVIGIGAYYYVNQPEQTPAEKIQSAAEDASDAVGEAASAAQEAASDALNSATEQASEAASSIADQANAAAEQAGQAATDLANQASDTATDLANQATDTATDLANQAGDQVAALTGQGQELFNSWIQDGMLTAQQFDYEKMVASVQESSLTQEIKTQAIKILDDIKAAPDTVVEKIQELRNLLTQQ